MFKLKRICLINRSDSVQRDTLQNIIETKEYTLNYVRSKEYEKAHQTSARYDKGISEFEKVGFEEIPLPQDIPDELAETVYFMEKALNVTQNQSSILTDNAVWDGIFGKRN